MMSLPYLKRIEMFLSAHPTASASEALRECCTIAQVNRDLVVITYLPAARPHNL
jgi:hypothetical protein